MAVELRCPDCRAKLRLSEYPDPGTEVECPECNAIFPAPDPDTGEVPDRAAKKKKPADDDADDRPKKKKKRDDDDGDEKKPAAEEKKKDKKGGDKKQPKKRRAKKKETNKAVLFLLIGGGLVFLITLIGLLAWYFTRKPASYEMMNYLPEDCNEAVGLNLGHMHKYPAFYEKLDPALKETGFMKAADALAKASGQKTEELLDYMVQGSGKSGDALIIKTKKTFDEEALAKLPGAAKKDGYYTISTIPGLSYQNPRVFAPTSRLIVFCPQTVPQDKFQKMLNGNKDNYNDTLVARLGPLGKRTVKGTFWALGVLDPTTRPKQQKKDEGGGSGGEFQGQLASTAATAQGFGFKASVGSKSIRFEVIVWCADGDVAAEQYTKFKESDLAKGDEAEPPRWWKDFAQSGIGNKKVAGELLANIGASTSGELFILHSECETKVFMEVVGSVAGKFAPQPQNTGGGT